MGAPRTWRASARWINRRSGVRGPGSSPTRPRAPSRATRCSRRCTATAPSTSWTWTVRSRTPGACPIDRASTAICSPTAVCSTAARSWRTSSASRRGGASRAARCSRSTGAGGKEGSHLLRSRAYLDGADDAFDAANALDDGLGFFLLLGGFHRAAEIDGRLPAYHAEASQVRVVFGDQARLGLGFDPGVRPRIDRRAPGEHRDAEDHGGECAISHAVLVVSERTTSSCPRHSSAFAGTRPDLAPDARGSRVPLDRA